MIRILNSFVSYNKTLHSYKTTYLIDFFSLSTSNECLNIIFIDMGPSLTGIY